MTYDYVRRTYEFEPRVGRRVRHDETQKEGVITAENLGCAHYVQVQFDGADFSLPCHPDSLEYVDGPQ